MKTATRLNGIGEYYFSAKLREIELMNLSGKQVINLGIGSPDLPPHPDVIHALQETAARPDAHAYQGYKGIAPLREAIANWYAQWYGVTLNPDREVLPLMGSKEGIMHICMTYLGEGDIALIPNPGYPTYRSAVELAGAEAVTYTLTEDNNWEPDWEALAAMDLSRVKLMWINYPHMPTGHPASVELMETAVAFAKKHGIYLCHDNPYSFILNNHPLSFLSVPGAKEVVIELNSLSKSVNMAGWRMGMLCAGAERIEEILRFKSNMDSGMFLPIQMAAVKALTLGRDWYDSLNATYRSRREKVKELLQVLGLNYDDNQTGMFVWARIPDGYRDGFHYSDDVLKKANVFITPGGIFGTAGAMYIRISLCANIEKLEQAIERLTHNILIPIS